MEGKHVLVVDDQPSMRLLLRKYLESAGLRVSEAKDADSAFSQISTDPPDIVVLDLKMPGTSGHTVLTQLKSDKEFREFKAPVLVLTGQIDWVNVDASLAEGADAFMSKTTPREELMAKIEELLARNRPAG
jgi:DNA-binding response OmpR family regulator